MVRSMTGRGFTLIETALVLAIFAIIIYMAAFSFLNLASKYRLEKAVGEVRAALNTARAKSILNGCNFRVRFGADCYRIENYDETANIWIPDTAAGIEGATVEANNTPVFTPEGAVTNLATIRISNGWGGYKLTLAITGRIKTTRLPA
ncbi:MAG: prepilin-type N-terminal cleavage/methylation domain-containing protein [Candidatus Aminicenantes bacterium]|nr:prepilin-type N-terminal cleavage/methylation domain-containing protein [Candidatus Aminicenantes bacterium]